MILLVYRWHARSVSDLSLVLSVSLLHEINILLNKAYLPLTERHCISLNDDIQKQGFRAKDIHYIVTMCACSYILPLCACVVCIECLQELIKCFVICINRVPRG